MLKIPGGGKRHRLPATEKISGRCRINIDDFVFLFKTWFHGLTEEYLFTGPNIFFVNSFKTQPRKKSEV